MLQCLPYTLLLLGFLLEHIVDALLDLLIHFIVVFNFWLKFGYKFIAQVLPKFQFSVFWVDVRITRVDQVKFLEESIVTEFSAQVVWSRDAFFILLFFLQPELLAHVIALMVKEEHAYGYLP